MKALTLKQPHATLVVAGLKQIETRSWGTSYRGRVAIHASAAIDDWTHAACLNPIIRAALQQLGYGDAYQLPVGAVLGEAYLRDVLRMTDNHPRTAKDLFPIGPEFCDARLTERERAMGIYAHGRRAWILQGARRYEKPIPARGRQGVWEFYAPSKFDEEKP